MDELWAKSTNIEEDETVDKVVKNRVDRILLGIKPINPNTDLRGTPTIDTTPHTEPKNITQKIGDGISYVADGIKNTASEWADNRLRNMSMDIYSNLYDPDPDKEKRLKQAHEIGDPLGLPAQMLVDSKEAYEMAQNQYAWMRTQEIMQGKAFSANALKELYPELVDIAMDDPVSASLALKKADQILHDRGIIVGASPLGMTGEPSVLEETFKTFANAWEAGQNMDKISEIGYKARNGEITIDEMNNRIEKISKQTKEYEGESIPGIIATETVKNISMMSTQMLRSAPLGLATGVGLMTVAGAPLVGTAWLATIFYSSWRSNAGSNYYRLVNKRNSDGSRMYTDGEAKNMAGRDARGQAFVETVLMKIAYGTLGKAFGKGIAKAAIMNASTRNKLLSASRGAMRKYAVKEAAKQYVKGTAEEVAEEGLQDLISTTDEWLVGKDKTMNAKAMWNSAVSAMFEALPAAIGMGLPGAVLSGGGNYIGLKNLTKEDWTMAREAYYRENEKNMTSTILKERDSNAIFKISPKIFAQKTQAQMDKAGMGTVYIDAATAAETEKGREALNRLVEEEIATQEQIDSAVKDGSQLELKSGVYMQKVNEETAGILSDYAAFDKNGKTIHEINEARQRLIKTINLVNQTKEKREQEVAETILERDFEEGLAKEAMRKIFAEGMDDIKGNYKKLKEEAFKAYGDLIGYDHYAGYTPLGVDLVPVEAGAKNYRTGEIDTTGHVGDRYIRQSNNEAWYSDAWKKYGRKPNKRELYDIAERETIKEIDSAVYTEEERKQALGTIEQARKEAETFEQLEGYINGLDTKEITERTLLSEKAYNMVYLPTIEALKNAPAKVAEAKRESAFIYARMVDNFAEMYKLPIENIVASLQINDSGVNGYRQAMFDVRKAGIVSIDTFYNRVTAGVKKGESPTKIKYTSQSGVTYAGDRMVHIIKHGFSKEDIIDLDKSMNNLYDPVFTTWQDGNFEGQHRGDHILAKVKGDHGNYYVVLSFSKNGIVWIDTAVKEKDGGIYKKEIEDKRARRLTDETAASSSHHLTPISISTIQKELGIVKKEEYNQPVNADVDPDEKVRIVDLTNTYKPGITKKELVQLLRNMAKEGATFTSADEKAILSILPTSKQVRHIVYSSVKVLTQKEEKTRIKSIESIGTLIRHSVLIESEQNQKKTKKPDVEMYHRFYVPVKVGEQVYAVRIVAEERNGTLNLLPKELNLYDVIIEKRPIPTSGIGYPVGGPNGSFSTVTIKEMLQNVKDMENMPYYQKKEEYAGAYDEAEAKLAQDEAAFSHNVDLFMDGKLKGGNVKVMTTPLVMKLVGAEILPVETSTTVLSKLLHGKHSNELDENIVKQIPRALTDPVAVFQSKTKKGRLVVALELKDKNKSPIVVPFALDISSNPVDTSNGYYMNFITSAYGKDYKGRPNIKWFYDEINAGRMCYGNKKKLTELLGTAGLYLPQPPKSNELLLDIQSVPNETDLVKLKNENPEYYQQKEEYAGAYDAGENAIHIFSAGNQSTVVHEAAHWWLSMLSRIAEDKEFEEISKENPQMEAALKKAKKDRMDIRAWAMYAPEVMKEYKGTVLEKEFNAYEKEIQQNPRDKELQERFIQERFARGFERYLMTGKAPTKELQGAFRRFKKWMISVYRTTKEIMKNPQQALGLKEPPAEIKDIFDHMLATEEEINAWSAEKRLHTIYDTGIDYTKTEKENVAGWLEDIKETIKEEALSYFMHQIKGEQMQNFETRQLPEMMETFKEQLIYNPVYRLEALRSKNLFPTKEMWDKALEAEGYTEETYIKAVKEAGGSIEEQIKNFEKTQRENFKSSLSDKDYIRRLAEEKMESEEGKAKLAEIEKEMLGKRIKKYGRVAAAALLELERIEKKDVKNTAWKVIYEIKKENGLLTKEDEAHGEKVKSEEIEELKLQIAGIQNGLNEAAASLYYTPTDLKQEARAFLYGKEIYKATNYKWWNRKAEAEGRKAAEAMKERHWSTAAYRKQRQLRFSYNALMAKEYDDHVRTVLHGNPKASTDIYDKDGLEKYGIIGLINRVSKRDSSIQMKNNARYFIHHLAFQLGLITKDGNAPLDGAGNPAPFDWKNLNAEIDVLSVMEGQSPEDIVPQWIKTIFERKDKTNIRDLPVVDFDELVDVCKEVYKIGRREYEGNTFAGENGKLLSFSDAAEIIVDKMGISFENPKLKKLGETKLKKIKDKAGNWVGELALPEIFIERMGPEIYNLIYKPMDNAFQVKRKLESEAREKFKEIMNIYPDRETWRKIRADKIYKLTEDVDGKPVIVTKEILLSIALNMGTKTNQERVSETYGMTYNAIMNALEKYMDNRDWDFVEAVWEHINSYWPQRNIVQNSLYGVPLGKVPGQTIVLSNGRKIKGMYYPIKYDGELSSKTKERELNDIVRKEMLGSHTFNIGMGSTKKRAEGSGGQYIRDDLEVYIEYINESINHIAMRETTADIYKLLARKDVAEAITDRYGSEAHRRLLQWATDCWHDPVDKLGNLERYLDRMRKKFTMATMGYRISTALLNLANIPLVIEKTGPRNFIRGLSDMYMSGADKYREQRAFIFEKSSFMKERATTMDRDLARGLRMKEDRGTSKAVSKIKGGKEIIDQYGFSLIAETDFMFSLPEWIQTYNNTVFELQMKRNMTAEEIEKEAVRKADKIVRETFGSGEMKDRPAVVKSRFLSQLLPFYSYTSLVLNQFIRGGYDIVDGKGPGRLIRSFIFWYLFGAAFEGALRYLIDQATGNDKYTFLGRLGYSYASNGPVSGLPVARDVVPAMYSLFMGMYSDGAVPEVSGLQIIEDIYKTGSAVKSDNKDWIDVGQAATKTTNKLTGLSDTVTDGLWAIARLTFTDTDATAFESIASILFDRKIKKKGERK